MFAELKKWGSLFVLVVGLITAVFLIISSLNNVKSAELDVGETVITDGEYVVLSWNDLGMHCYNRDFQDLAVLPPYNTLWAQVVKKGDPPQIITEDITT